MQFRKELVGATTRALILSVLSKGDGHGYEIVRSVNALSEGVFEWREGTIYPALHKLEKIGFIKGDWQEASSGRRRRVYRLTEEGRRELAHRKQEWKTYSKAVSKVMEECHA